MRPPSWQYQGYVEPLFTQPAAPFDPALLAWLPDYPARIDGLPRSNATALTSPPWVTAIEVTEPPDLGLPRPEMTLVPRVMVRGDRIDAERLRRLSETVEHVLNSLFRKGILNQLRDPDDYSIVAGGFAADRAPGVGDDETKGARSGVSWVNRTTQTVYFCMSADEGNAVWVAVN